MQTPASEFTYDCSNCGQRIPAGDHATGSQAVRWVLMFGLIAPEVLRQAIASALTSIAPAPLAATHT
jgi:hypothetical protein